MKKINTELIKELIISILIVIAIALILSVVFYDKISLGKIIPESEEYQLTEEMQESMNSGILEESKEIITNYYIDAADLKGYEKTKEYSKGKVNPFAAMSSNSNNSVSNQNKTSSNNTSSVQNEASTNYFEDDGTK